VLGTRLAVFAPMPRSGSSSSTKSTTLRTSSRTTCAITRAMQRSGCAHRRGVPVVLGSATPSLETWLAAREGRYRRLDLPERADVRAQLPVVHLSPHRAASAHDGIGDALRAAIAIRLDRGEQSLVFVNRRGYAPSLVCAACKWESECRRCSARLTVQPGAAIAALPSLRP
jgi:primosomal protein N' (replication factor Y)